jgi:hypothetical protein
MHAARAAGQEGAGEQAKATAHINLQTRYQRSVRECRPESLERGANPGSTLLSCRRRGGRGAKTIEAMRGLGNGRVEGLYLYVRGGPERVRRCICICMGRVFGI